jgi:hypothetical protein
MIHDHDHEGYDEEAAIRQAIQESLKQQQDLKPKVQQQQQQQHNSNTNTDITRNKPTSHSPAGSHRQQAINRHNGSNTDSALA